MQQHSVREHTLSLKQMPWIIPAFNLFEVAYIQYLKAEKITWTETTSYVLLSVWATNLEPETEEQTLKTANLLWVNVPE